jgi:hypothetical protein
MTTTVDNTPTDDDSKPAKGKRVKKEKKPRDPDAPKKPLSGFMLYSAAERAKTPDVKIKAAELAERWRALSDDERAAYKSSPSA